MSVTAVPIRPIKKGSVAKLWAAIIVLGALAAALAWYGTEWMQFRTTPSGLQYRVIKAGEGINPTSRDFVLIDYIGRTTDGKVFDSSQGRQPQPMPVNGFVPGFSEGLQLMTKGSTYRLRIPPELAYGEQGNGEAIPPGSTLIFDIALHQFWSERELQQLMAERMGAMGGMPGMGAPPPQ